MTVIQIWECAGCGKQYHSPLRVGEVVCKGKHLKPMCMVLISGPPAREVKPIWKEKHKPKSEPTTKAQPKKGTKEKKR